MTYRRTSSIISATPGYALYGHWNSTLCPSLRHSCHYNYPSCGGKYTAIGALHPRAVITDIAASACYSRCTPSSPYAACERPRIEQFETVLAEQEDRAWLVISLTATGVLLFVVVPSPKLTICIKPPAVERAILNCASVLITRRDRAHIASHCADCYGSIATRQSCRRLTDYNYYTPSSRALHP